MFGTLSFKIRMFYDDVLQDFNNNQRSPESWSSLLTSPPAENNAEACALRQSIEKTQEMFVLKDMKLAACLVASSHVLTLARSVL